MQSVERRRKEGGGRKDRLWKRGPTIKAVVGKIMEYDFNVPKMRFPHGNDTKMKRRYPQGGCQKTTSRGTAAKENHHGRPNDKKYKKLMSYML